MRFRALAQDLGFTEGPVHLQGSGIAATALDRGTVAFLGTAAGTALVAVGGAPNGAAQAADGDLLVAQNGGWTSAGRTAPFCGGVQRVGPTSAVTWVTQDPVAPNDLCFGPDGFLYVTDPTRKPSRDDGRLWRVDVTTGYGELLTSVPWFPNGIAFGHESDAVYVASTFEQRIVRWPLTSTGLGPPETFARLRRGLPDGMAFDADGNLAVAAVSFSDEPGVIEVFDADGESLESIFPGPNHLYTNLAIDEQGSVVVTDSQAGAVLVGLDPWPVPGLALHPFRA